MGTIRLALATLILPAIAITAAPASAAGPSSVAGTVTNQLGTITVHAHNTGPGTEATGWFVADGNILVSPLSDLLDGVDPELSALGAFHFEGPVTCLDVRGNRAGLIYPITEAEGSPLAQRAEGQAIYVTIVDNGGGNPDTVGFAGPAPINDLDNCPPTLAFMQSDSGNITVHDADR